MRHVITQIVKFLEGLRPKLSASFPPEASKPNMIDDYQTFGNGSFTWEEWPVVCGVLVYRDSGVRSVKVTGADEPRLLQQDPKSLVLLWL